MTARAEHGGISIAPEVLRQARRLRARTRRRVNGHFAGQYLSVFRGSGVEFAEVREYVPGDDIRSIDWNVSARAGRAFVKRYVEERNLSVIIAVDASASTAFRGGGSAKRERATEIALALATSALSNGDRVGLALFTDRIERWLPPRRGRNTGLSIATALLGFEPASSATSLHTALEYLAAPVQQRSLIFVLSDFIDEADYTRPLRALATRHDVVPVWLHTRLEAALPKVGLLSLRDLESGELSVVDTASERVREHYRAARERVRADIATRFRRLGIEHVSIDVEDDWCAALLAFFAARARRMESGR